MTVRAPSMCSRAYAFVRTIIADDHADARLSDLRQELAAWLDRHARCEDAITVADELTSNALVHGTSLGGLVTLVVERLDAGRLSIDVVDSGRVDGDVPCITKPQFGQGLDLVRSLCEEVQTVPIDDGGRRVQAVLAAQAPEIAEPDIDEKELLASYDDDVWDTRHRIGGGYDAS